MVSQSLRPAAVNVMVRAAEKASRGLMRDFNEVENLQISQKSIGDFVTNADKRSEETIIYELKKARPNYSIISEESEKIEGTDPEYTWIVDPLDGTTNFIHNIPHFSITIALMKGNEIVSGIIYDPAKDDLFWSEKGKGSFLNHKRIRVSPRKRLSESLIGVGIPNINRGSAETFQKHMSKLIPNVAGMRRMGSASLDLAYVASGRLDAYIDYILHPWDIAAGSLIVREAGGFSQSLDGKSDFTLSPTSILATNATFNKSIKRLFSDK